MASQVEGGADTRLAGGLGSGGGSSQLHDIKLYTRVAFPSPRPPNDEYQRWKAIQENKMDVINTNWNSISIQELAIPTLILATHQIYIST